MKAAVGQDTVGLRGRGYFRGGSSHPGAETRM